MIQKQEVQQPSEVPATTFAALQLTAPLLKALADEGYDVPTPIQTLAIPHVLAGRDLFGCAQTGTGKTAAFALPLIERLIANRTTLQPRRCRVLVLAPTRELAGQIHESFRAYGRHVRIKAAVIYGGVGQRPQAVAMQQGVDVLVATPGRLLDLIQQRLVDIRSVEALVLDEADRMLDMGFIHDMRKIVAMIPRERQTLLFSATLPQEIRELASSWLRDPLELKTTPQSTPAETVEQSLYFIEKRRKKNLLAHLLAGSEMSRVIVFTRTKHGADKLTRDLEKSGIRAAAIHGNKSQNHRERSLQSFKSQHPPVLIATDIAARGIDVDQVSHVVNYDLPHEPETYVHRIGRTGRAGFTGKAIAFCDRDERTQLRDIERMLRKSINVLPLPPNLADAAPAEGEVREEREQRHRPHVGQQNRRDGRHRTGTVIGREPRPQGQGGGGRDGGRGNLRMKKSRSGFTAPRAEQGRSEQPRSDQARSEQSHGNAGSQPAAGTAVQDKPKFAKKKHRRAL